MTETVPAPREAHADPRAVRDHLVEALNLDLIGPWENHAHAGERLPGWVRPSNWYLTGFLIPSGTDPDRSADADEDDDLDETPDSGGLAEESSEERRAAKKGFFPSSMGLSFLVAREADALTVIVRWGDYERAEAEDTDGKSASVWQQRPNERTLRAPLRPSPIPLESCPWCGTRFEPASFTLLPNDERPAELRIVCANFECDFSGDRPLPVLAVDEPIYRRLPAFLIATVDKFASLPWVAETGKLLGGAERFNAARGAEGHGGGLLRGGGVASGPAARTSPAASRSVSTSPGSASWWS